MPSEKKPRQKFIADLRSDKTETYQKILNKIINPDLQQPLLDRKLSSEQERIIPIDQIDQEKIDHIDLDQEKDQKKDQDQAKQEKKTTSTKPTISLANDKLSQDSLANSELSQPIAKLSINQEEKLGQSLAKPTISLANYYRTWNQLDDEVMPNLHPSEQLVLRRLYRLSYGFNRQHTDNVSLAKIAEKCNLGIATVKLAIKALQDKGLIEIESDLSRNPNGGNRYRVLTKLIDSSANDELSQLIAKPAISYIKHDDDPLKRHDHHHQSEHEKEVMMIYQKLTENSWTKADIKSYEKVKSIPTEKIELAIRLAKERSSNRPNSFAYFVKEILTVANPPQQSRSQRKKALEKIVDRVRTTRVGGNSYTISDLAYDVKEICVREGIMFDHDIFNEIINKNKS